MRTLLIRLAPAERVALAMQLLRFGVVGACGFAVTTGVVYLTRPWIGDYWAIVPGFLLAVTVTWALNRLWTFRGHGARRLAWHREWTMFVGANLLGFGLNASVYWTLVALSPACAANPVLALLAGTLVGMVANFALSRQLVFR
jgi:putative flippase GtrA